MQEFISQFLRLIRPHRKVFQKAIAFIVVLEALMIVPTYLFKEVLDTLTLRTDDLLSTILWLALGIFVAQTLIAAVDVIVDRYILDALYWMENELPKLAQKKLLALSLGFHEQEQTGEQIARLERGTMKLVEFGGQLLWMLIPLLMQITWTSILMIALDWQLAILFAIVIPIFAIMTWHLHHTTYPWRKEQEDLYENSAGRLCESVINIKTVQAFAQEQREKKRYGAMRGRIYDLGRLRWMFGTRMNFWRMMIINFGRLGIISLAGYKAITGELTIGSVVLFLTLSEKVYISMFNLNQILDRMVEATEPMQRLFNIIHTKPRVVSAPGAIAPKRWTGAITFDDVTFGYTPEQNALSNVNFSINPGETVAFAGPSGGGKSTIVKLLFRYYDPNSGTIRIDGNDLRGLSLQAYRRMTGYVPQEVEIMSGTIWENIAYGNPKATEQAVKRVAKLARVHEFASTLPDGYNTIVGERGMKLSGGQRQRVGIARALLNDPTVVVFDEATSNLDAESERAIQDALSTLEGKKTLILIAHRLSTIMHADKIIIVEDGRVAEVGTHDQLMRQNGLYHRLVQLQTEGG